jgi:hypothetical protein
MSDEQPVYNELIEQHRIGRFSISHHALRYSTGEQLCSLFGNFIVMRAESMFVSDSIEYLAYSALFEPCDYGDIPPEYTLKITQETDDTWIVEVEKLNGR